MRTLYGYLLGGETSHRIEHLCALDEREGVPVAPIVNLLDVEVETSVRCDECAVRCDSLHSQYLSFIYIYSIHYRVKLVNPLFKKKKNKTLERLRGLYQSAFTLYQFPRV